MIEWRGLDSVWDVDFPWPWSFIINRTSNSTGSPTFTSVHVVSLQSSSLLWNIFQHWHSNLKWHPVTPLLSEEGAGHWSLWYPGSTSLVSVRHGNSIDLGVKAPMRPYSTNSSKSAAHREPSLLSGWPGRKVFIIISSQRSSEAPVTVTTNYILRGDI